MAADGRAIVVFVVRLNNFDETPVLEIVFKIRFGNAMANVRITVFFFFVFGEIT